MIDWIPGTPPSGRGLPGARLENSRVRARRWHRKLQNLDAEIPEVIAWDGEGYGDLNHRYVILANSLGHEISDVNGLSTMRCLDLLFRGAMCDPEAVNVVFGGTYDFNNWLRDINRETAVHVNRGQLVKLGKFLVRFNGTWFELERANRLVKFWDIWRFWGTRFDLALEECLPDFHGLAEIQRMKAERAEFNPDRMVEMSAYNRLELEATVLMMKQLYGDLIEARIRRPTYLTGAGALAGSLLNQYGVLDHNRALPTEVLDASLVAYYGGRIEPWQVGTYDGPVYTYDIRNAYCYALTALPTLRSGHWEYVADVDPRSVGWDGRLSVWEVEWCWDVRKDKLADETASYFPFPYRFDNGLVSYPNWGHGWYWWPEVATALDLGWQFKVHGGWVWYSDEDELPFGWVPGLYKHRMALKMAGRVGAAREIKFAMNALYGKLCQARGHPSWNPPAHHNLAWAGWVTSHCRAQLMEAVHERPWSVLYVMTDSVATTQPLDLTLGEELGTWEFNEYERAQVVQAGVATLWKGGEAETMKYRGFDEGSVNPLAIERAWKLNFLRNKSDALVTQVRRPVNLASALTSEDRFDLWNSWIVNDRELELYGGGGKRWRYWETNQYRLWREMGPLAAWSAVLPTDVPGAEIPMSARYQPKWTDTEDKFAEAIAGGLRDRDVADVRSASVA